MKMTEIIALLASIGLALCGCRSTPRPIPPKGQPVAPPREPGVVYQNPGKLYPRVQGILPVSEEVEPIRVGLKSDGTEPRFAVELQQFVIGHAKSGAVRITDGEDCDFQLNLTPRFVSETVVAGLHYAGLKVDATLTPANSHTPYASQLMEFKAQVGQKSAEQAKFQLVPIAGAQVAEWTAEQLNRLATDKYNAVVVRFALSAKKREDLRLWAVEMQHLEEAIKGLAGVVGYRRSEYDPQGFCAFRVVCFAEKYPQGLTTAIFEEMARQND